MDSSNTSMILNSDFLLDEGIEIIDVEAQVVASSTNASPLIKKGSLNGKLQPDGLKGSDDSGFSSRMSEGDAEERERSARHSLLAAANNGVLRKRLTRISECQYDDPCRCTLGGCLRAGVKVTLVFCLLYLFICTLDLLSNAFRLLGGKTAGSVFQDSELLQNPITGLMIGVLSTVILQSSSTSSSIVITMVASGILPIEPAIPIIMGANIGTTVTNTLVSLAHSTERREFRRAFSGAVIHDVFNWLTVLILLPLEYCTGYLMFLTHLVVGSLSMDGLHTEKTDLLKTLTKPLTKRIVQLDKSVITGIAEGKMENMNKTILKVYCSYEAVDGEWTLVNQTTDQGWAMVNISVNHTLVPQDKCESLLSWLAWSDSASGALLLLCSVTALSLCLYTMVKVLHSLLGGHMAKAARRTINADLPGPCKHLTGYVAIVVGAGMTVLVQSSSVFTSALTPLVGIGCLKLERMLPLTLGSNIGTTFTGILAALASPAATLPTALQLALCHLFFNITGIMLFYPVPKLRGLVLGGARYLGRTTAKYRWFAIAYLVCMFVLFPGFFFLTSFMGRIVFIVSISVLGAVGLFVTVVNVMQSYPRSRRALPVALQTWNFLPEWLRSLAPYDRCLGGCVEPLSRCCCQCLVDRCSCLNVDHDDDDDDDDSYLYSEDESDGSMVSSYVPTAANSTVSSTANLTKVSGAPKRKILKYSPVVDKNESSQRASSDSPRQVVVNIPSSVSPDEIQNITESVI